MMFYTISPSQLLSLLCHVTVIGQTQLMAAQPHPPLDQVIPMAIT
jgi:hypothetical protein